MRVGMRYTILYGAMSLLSGLGLIAIVAGFGASSTTRAGGGTAPTRDAQIADLRQQLDNVEEAQSRQLIFGVLTALVVLVLLSLVLGRLVAGRVLRPLRVITAVTRRITADSLHERLGAGGPEDEVKALADTIDELLERLESSFAAQRRFVADASHELRTPLATIRASLDVAMAKPGPVPAETRHLAGRVRAELDRIERLMEGFLLLARAQHGALDHRDTVSLTALAAAALRAHKTDLRVYADLTADVPTRGNPVLLARLVDNVVDNAVRHNVPSGWIRVGVAPDGGRAVLRVESSGPVLDPAEVAELGRPFRRLGADRTGSGLGLGLSIVGAVTAAHGGTLDLAARPGGGLRLTVALPLAIAVPA